MGLGLAFDLEHRHAYLFPDSFFDAVIGLRPPPTLFAVTNVWGPLTLALLVGGVGVLLSRRK